MSDKLNKEDFNALRKFATELKAIRQHIKNLRDSGSKEMEDRARTIEVNLNVPMMDGLSFQSPNEPAPMRTDRELREFIVYNSNYRMSFANEIFDYLKEATDRKTQDLRISCLLHSDKCVSEAKKLEAYITLGVTDGLIAGEQRRSLP